jgi:hypothetical protein
VGAAVEGAAADGALSSQSGHRQNRFAQYNQKLC